ncbi:hypothetical protein BX616_007819, partial [Lobosporangium transversale]
MEEREKAYAEARARIFDDDRPKQPADSVEASTGLSASSLGLNERCPQRNAELVTNAASRPSRSDVATAQTSQQLQLQLKQQQQQQQQQQVLGRSRTQSAGLSRRVSSSSSSSSSSGPEYGSMQDYHSVNNRSGSSVRLDYSGRYSDLGKQPWSSVEQRGRHHPSHQHQYQHPHPNELQYIACHYQPIEGHNINKYQSTCAHWTNPGPNYFCSHRASHYHQDHAHYPAHSLHHSHSHCNCLYQMHYGNAHYMPLSPPGPSAHHSSSQRPTVASPQGKQHHHYGSYSYGSRQTSGCRIQQGFGPQSHEQQGARDMTPQQPQPPLSYYHQHHSQCANYYQSCGEIYRQIEHLQVQQQQHGPGRSEEYENGQDSHFSPTTESGFESTPPLHLFQG